MRLRRRSDKNAETPTDAAIPENADALGAATEAPSSEGQDFDADPRARGPFDVSEKPVDPEDVSRADLGALSVLGRPDVELRLQVDNDSGVVAAVMLIAEDGALELRPFAAPRHDDLWVDIMPQIEAEAARIGGRTARGDGPYGPALRLEVPAKTPEGQEGVQQSMVFGIAGPRWLLRVSAFGRPAVAYNPDAPLETALREVVVIRGSEPMAPGDALELRLPKHAIQMSADTPDGDE